MPVSEVATFFGPEDSPLYGVLHLPADKQIRGGVVVCGSLGREGMLGDRLRRVIANELANRGYAVLRFDYLGTGNSAFLQNRDDAVDNWLHSLDYAITYLLEIGAQSITAMGFRAGCLILNRALGDSRRVDQVVYVDPIGTGRRYLREQTTLLKLSIGADSTPADTIPIIGARLSAAAATKFRAMTMSFRPEGVHHLLVVRPDQSDPQIDALAQLDGVDSVAVAGLAEFAQSAQTVTLLPLRAIDTVVDWMDATGSEARNLATPHYITSVRIPTADPTGTTSIVESIETVGPAGLFAIRTRPERSLSGEGKVVVFYTSANDPHVGPAREWVELSRSIAEAGAQALRWDRAGVGQSGPVSREQWHPIYSQTDVRDAIDVARHAAANPQNLLVAGPCSGSWYAAQAARAVGAGSAILVNPRVWTWPIGATHLWQRNLKKSLLTALSPGPSSGSSGQRFLKRATSYALRILQKAGRSFTPPPIIRMLGRLGYVQVPEIMLAALAEGGTATTVLLSPWDAELFTARGGPVALQRLDTVALPPRLVTTNLGDHALYHQAMLDAIHNVVLESVEPTNNSHECDLSSSSVGALRLPDQ